MSKERLEEIISREAYLEGTNDLAMVISTEDYKWLIEQAERVQELEEDLLELVKQNKELRKSIAFYSSESYNAHLERLLDRSEKQIKRYREALEFYANEEKYLFDEKEYKVGLGVPESEITLDYGNKAREALEESE